MECHAGQSWQARGAGATAQVRTRRKDESFSPWADDCLFIGLDHDEYELELVANPEDLEALEEVIRAARTALAESRSDQPEGAAKDD